MERERVLQVCALNPGGIETFVMNSYRAINQQKVVFDFINYFDSNEEQFHEKEVLSLGSRVHKTGTMNYSNLFKRHFLKILSLYKFLTENDYKIIHIHASDSISLIDAIVAKVAGIPKIIVHSHNTSISKNSSTSNFKNFFHKLIKGLWPLFATDFLACSDLASEWLFTEKMRKEKKIEIVNNAIDIEKYQFNLEIRNTLRKEFGLEDKVIIGHIGRMSYQKNHEFLINTFYELKKINSNVVLLLIGTGELEMQLKTQVNDLGLKDSVIFYGVSTKVNELMNAIDIFVLPSHFEGLPLVGIEAQCSGLKVIASDGISKQMKVTDNVHYLSLDLGSEKWAQYIDNMLIVKDRFKYSLEVRENGYDIKEVVKKLEQIYNI